MKLLLFPVLVGTVLLAVPTGAVSSDFRALAASHLSPLPHVHKLADPAAVLFLQVLRMPLLLRQATVRTPDVLASCMAWPAETHGGIVVLHWLS